MEIVAAKQLSIVIETVPNAFFTGGVPALTVWEREMNEIFFCHKLFLFAYEVESETDPQQNTEHDIHVGKVNKFNLL